MVPKVQTNRMNTVFVLVCLKMGKKGFNDLIVKVQTFLLTFFLFQLEEFDLFGASRKPDSLVAGVFVQIVKTGTIGFG
jgi:hypothetical protein